VNTQPPPICASPTHVRSTLTVARGFEILWESAWEALVLAFLIRILGGVAVGIVSGICGEMTPSLPPAMAHRLSPEAEPSPFWHAVGSGFHRHELGILFAVLFLAKSAARLLQHSPDEDRRRAADRVHRVLGRLSDGWFGLVVANAFVAFMGVMLLQFTRQFSWSQILWNLASGWVQSWLDALAHLLPGHGNQSALREWVNWYQQNQFKFLFWVLYLGAIGDDLGLPNYKALGRWLWLSARRRWHDSGASAAKVDAS